MVQIIDAVAANDGVGDPNLEANIAAQVKTLCAQFPIY